MLGFNWLNQKRILLGLLVSICMLVLFASELSEESGNLSSLVAILASNSSPAPIPFIDVDELNPASPDRGNSNARGVSGRDTVVAISAHDRSISDSNSISFWVSDSAGNLAGKSQHACRLLDIPPPSDIAA